MKQTVSVAIFLAVFCHPPLLWAQDQKSEIKALRDEVSKLRKEVAELRRIVEQLTGKKINPVAKKSQPLKKTGFVIAKGGTPLQQFKTNAHLVFTKDLTIEGGFDGLLTLIENKKIQIPDSSGAQKDLLFSCTAWVSVSHKQAKDWTIKAGTSIPIKSISRSVNTAGQWYEYTLYFKANQPFKHMFFSTTGLKEEKGVFLQDDQLYKVADVPTLTSGHFRLQGSSQTPADSVFKGFSITDLKDGRLTLGKDLNVWARQYGRLRVFDKKVKLPLANGTTEQFRMSCFLWTKKNSAKSKDWTIKAGQKMDITSVQLDGGTNGSNAHNYTLFLKSPLFEKATIKLSSGQYKPRDRYLLKCGMLNAKTGGALKVQGKIRSGAAQRQRHIDLEASKGGTYLADYKKAGTVMLYVMTDKKRPKDLSKPLLLIQDTVKIKLPNGERTVSMTCTATLLDNKDVRRFKTFPKGPFQLAKLSVDVDPKGQWLEYVFTMKNPYLFKTVKMRLSLVTKDSPLFTEKDRLIKVKQLWQASNGTLVLQSF